MSSAASQATPGPEPGGELAPVALGVWELAGPTMALFALQAVVGFVSLVIVADLGATAVAAVGIALQVHFVLFAVLEAVTTGTIALVARAMGARDLREADRVLRLSLVLSLALAAAAMGAMPWTEAIVATFGVEAEVVRLGGSYLRILLAFNLPLAFGVAMASALRGAGDVRLPLYVGGAANLVNLVACWALVYGRLGLPALGTDGAALATGLAFVVGTALLLALWIGNRLVIPRSGWTEGLDLEGARRILRIGLPTAVEQGAWQAGLWLFLRLVAEYGTEPVSAYLIGVRILSFSFVPGLGFAMAAATLVGQHLGAGRPDLATRSGWRADAAAVAVMGGLGLVIVLLAHPIANAFGAAGARTVSLTVSFITILGAAQPLMAVEYALGGALRGAGDTRFPLFAVVTGLFLFRLAPAAFLARVLGGSVIAVWSCLLADYGSKAVLLTLRFLSGRWQRVKV